MIPAFMRAHRSSAAAKSADKDCLQGNPRLVALCPMRWVLGSSPGLLRLVKAEVGQDLIINEVDAVH